jgi:Ni,Fe-hydrogenase I cytochrome b subunit
MNLFSLCLPLATVREVPTSFLAPRLPTWLDILLTIFHLFWTGFWIGAPWGKKWFYWAQPSFVATILFYSGFMLKFLSLVFFIYHMQGLYETSGYY